jgi:hypothetical protein
MTQIRFDQLPLVDGTEERHAWDVWGRDDGLGSVNRLTPDRVLAAVRTVRQGKVISIDLPLDTPQPGLRPPFEYHLLNPGGGRDDYVDGFYLQGSSQIDGLGHMSLRGHGYWGGRDEKKVDSGEIGIDLWLHHGLVGRGVLIDAMRYAAKASGEDYGPDQRVALTGELMEEIAAEEKVDLNGADFLLLNTGWLRHYYLTGTDEDRAERLQRFGKREMPCPGLDGTRETIAWLWDHGVVGVLADNFACEALPVNREHGFQHRRLIPLVGMVVGELVDLERLAVDCAKDGQYEFMLTLTPLHIRGAVGSPSNGYAIK